MKKFTIVRYLFPNNLRESLYRILTLTAKPTRRLLKDESPPDGSNILYRVLTLTID